MANRIAILAATAALSIMIAIGPNATAAPTKTWSVDSYKEFDKGEAKSALITSTGEVRPGMSAKKIKEPGFTDAWSMVVGNGDELFVGTADDGAIYRINGGKSAKFATLKGVLAIVSLTRGPDGALYAGTMPDAQVWRIDKSGTAKLLATLKDAESVWSLAFASGAVYAGTGPKGKLFRIDPRSGKATVAFETADKRITALMAAPDGSVWLGTSDKALVFRHDPKRKTTRALGDFEGNEITAIAAWKGAAVVAANDLKQPSTGALKSKAAVDKASKKKENTGQKMKTPKAGSKPGAETIKTGTTPPRKGARKGKGALYRLRGDGQMTQLHALTSTYFTAIAVAPDGTIYAGAGDQGRIYQIDDDAVSTAIDVEQRVIAQLVFSRSGLRFSTADSTAVYSTSGAAKKSEYLSEAMDAKAAARFGSIIWRGVNVTLETRSGNTSDPGKGWSRWQAPTRQSAGPSGSRRGKVASPPGRYLQFRVRFNKQAAALSQTEVYYLAQNQPTQIEKFEIEVPKRKKKLVTVQSKLKPRSPIIEMSWDVDNDDGDETVYELRARRDGDVRWRLLTKPGEPLTETKFKWNTETFPDGFYRVKLTASDQRANPNGTRRETHKTSTLFAVDNQKPELDAINVRYPAASARATDALSAIAEAAFSIDDGPWMVAGTTDGLFDDQAEILRLELPRNLPSGIHSLAIRVADEAGNMGAASLSFRVP